MLFGKDINELKKKPRLDYFTFLNGHTPASFCLFSSLLQRNDECRSKF